ncbi:MAG TPA: hypothetical protein VFS43_26355 [Polyangiaceae bacterium]|nr:hypothetical protein [Polyangiaceae bacterium]
MRAGAGPRAPLAALAVDLDLGPHNGRRSDVELFVSTPSQPRVFNNRLYHEVPRVATGGQTLAEGGDSGGPSYRVDDFGSPTFEIVSVTSSGGAAVSFSSSRLDVLEAQPVKDAIAASGRLPGDCGLP